MRSLLPFRRRGQRRSRGQSLVEFALILPVMLVFLAAALDLGRVFYATISLNNAAREGAFQAAETPDSFDSTQPCNTATNLVVCRVQLEAKGSSVAIDPDDIDVACNLTGCPKQGGSTVTVSVTGSFQLITPLLSVVFGGQTIPISSSATAQVAYYPDPNLATLPPTPVAAFTMSPGSGMVLETITFDASASTGDPTDYQWDFGDGTQVVTQTPTVTHAYLLPDVYTVTLTVVNLATADIEQKPLTIGVVPGPSSSVAPSAAPSATCIHPVDTIGMTPGNARDALDDDFTVVIFGDLSSGPKNKIQAQNPDHTQCLMPGTPITLHYRPN
jgi:PKD repeat protein